jgi:amidase/6-aminohexanoate-cyclic-dimer hydrolase
VARFLESLGHHDALPAVDFRAAFAAQTTCYISNFAVVIGNLLAARGLGRPPADLVEPVNIRIWESGRHTSFAERAHMQAVFNTTSRGSTMLWLEFQRSFAETVNAYIEKKLAEE